MERLFYKHTETGEVYEYASKQEFQQFGVEGLVKMTAADVEQHLSPAKLTTVEVERARLIAYSDPITGSDRFKIEADAERLSGDENAAMVAEQKWLARRAEIAAELPWPEAE